MQFPSNFSSGWFSSVPAPFLASLVTSTRSIHPAQHWVPVSLMGTLFVHLDWVLFKKNISDIFLFHALRLFSLFWELFLFFNVLLWNCKGTFISSSAYLILSELRNALKSSVLFGIGHVILGRGSFQQAFTMDCPTSYWQIDLCFTDGQICLSKQHFHPVQ
jgi:hypothetical protein